MTTDTRPTFFFLHVMKTGGQSLLRHIADNFAPGETEPDVHDPDPDRRLPYASIARISGIPPDRRRRLRVVAGHVPYYAVDLIQPDVTLTVLRDPVDRTVSMLRQWRRNRPALHDLSLEQVYDQDPRAFPLLIRNYQTKLFSMTPGDDPSDLPHLADIVVDERRLETARTNLERVEVLGLQAHYAEFLDELCRRYGWQIKADHRLRVTPESGEVSPAFRERIAGDNAMDVAFFAYATEVHARRRAAPG